MKKDLDALFVIYRELPESFDNWPTSVNERSPAGDYPINIAAQRGSIDEVQLLIDHGADINQAGETGYRPLHNAVERGHLGLLKFLLDQGADAKATTDDGCTACELAHALDELEALKILER